MERKAYDFLVAAETSWWYRGRRRVVERALCCVSVPDGGYALDFGSGFGANYSLLRAYSTAVDAYEIDAAAAAGCAARGYRHIAQACDALTRQERYDLIGAFDVIEHLKDDAHWLRAIHERLAPGGTLVLSVPAFQSLWSEHDVLHKHFRRYTIPSITRVLADAGFRVQYATYWNSMLLPVAYLLRALNRGGGDNLTPRRPIGSLLYALLWLESVLVPYVRLPWGTGIVVVATRA